MEAIFTAADFSGLDAKVSAALVAFVLINLGFVGYKLVRRVMNKA